MMKALQIILIGYLVDVNAMMSNWVQSYDDSGVSIDSIELNDTISFSFMYPQLRHIDWKSAGNVWIAVIEKENVGR